MTEPYVKELTRLEKLTTSLTATLAYLFNGYVLLIVTYVLPPISADFHVSVEAVSLSVTAMLAGSVVGGIAFGWLADKVGRRSTFFFTIGVFALTTLVTAFASNLASLYALRFIAGLGSGGAWGIGFSLMNEALSERTRGLLGSFANGVFTAGGTLAALTVGYANTAFGDVSAWRYAFLITGGIPLLIIPMIFLVPESKIWREFDEQRRADLLPVGYDTRSPLVQIFSKEIIRTTAFATLTSVGFLFGFYSGQTFYATYFQVVSPSVSTYILSIGGLLGVVGSTLCGVFANLFGRKKGEILSGILYALSGIAFYLVVAVQPHFMGLATFPTFYAYAAVYLMSNGVGGPLGVWFGELYPTRMRSTGSNFSYLLGRSIGGGLGPIAVVILAAQLGSGTLPIGLAIGMSQIIGAMLVVVGAMGLRETKGVAISAV